MKRLLLAFLLTAIAASSFLVVARVNLFGVDFYLTKGAVGPEEYVFHKGETVYVVASPPVTGKTLDVQIDLIYPPGSNRPPATLLGRTTVTLTSERILAYYKIQDVDLEGKYAIRVTAWEGNEMKQTDISFEVVARPAMPWEIIVPVVVVLLIGVLAIILLRKPREAAKPQVETRVIQPGTFEVRAPSGETVTLAAYLQVGSKVIPLTQLPQVFGRDDFSDVAPPNLLSAISRRHFLIGYDYVQRTFYIEDLGSRNGTYVNGVDIRGKGMYPLKHGDVISPANVLKITFVSSPDAQPPQLIG